VLLKKMCIMTLDNCGCC